jgi:hypothetical protein
MINQLASLPIEDSIMTFPSDMSLVHSTAELTLRTMDHFLAKQRGSVAWSVPEHWIQGEIKRGLEAKNAGLYCWPEYPVKQLLESEPPAGLRMGFFDLVVYQLSTGLPDDDEFRGIIEVKMGIIYGYECLLDAIRIREIGRLWPHCGIVGGMFVHDADRVVSGMATSLQIDRSAIVCLTAAQPDYMGVNYGAVAALVQASEL